MKAYYYVDALDGWEDLYEAFCEHGYGDFPPEFYKNVYLVLEELEKRWADTFREDGAGDMRFMPDIIVNQLIKTKFSTLEEFNQACNPDEGIYIYADGTNVLKEFASPRNHWLTGKHLSVYLCEDLDTLTVYSSKFKFDRGL